MTQLNVNEMYINELRLYGVKANLPQRLSEAQKENLNYQDFLGLCLFDELSHRKNAKIKRLISNAAFKSSAAPEAIDTVTNRGLDKKMISELSTCRYIEEGKNILILGPTGVGKSYIATALGLAACRLCKSALFLRMNTLIEKLTLARVSANYLHQIKKFTSCDLLILDDYGIKPLQPAHYQDFYDLLEERFEGKSTIITTQVPEQNWGEIIDDQVTCEAVTRRITEKAIRIEMRGEAYAKRKRKD